MKGKHEKEARTTFSSGVKLMKDSLKEFWEDRPEAVGELDEREVLSDLLVTLHAYGYTAPQARRIAVHMIGYVPIALADAYGMKPSVR